MSNYGNFPPPPQQPPYGPQGFESAAPSNYLAWAILSTIFCCLPLGIVSIVFSTQVNNKWAVGDVAGAQDASEKAKKFAIWSVIAWAIIAVLYGIAIAVGFAHFHVNNSNGSGF
jgi:predicted secreted protein